MKNEQAPEKSIFSEIEITEDNNFINVSKILNLSELDDKYYSHNILSPGNSIAIFNELMKKETHTNMVNAHNNLFLEDKSITDNKKNFFNEEINCNLLIVK